MIQRCPTCDGHGVVSAGFFLYPAGAPFSSTTTGPEGCRTCQSSGLVRIEGDLVHPLRLSATPTVSMREVVAFTFHGYSQALSHGLVYSTRDGQLVLTDSPTNPGTSVSNAPSQAAREARVALGLDDEAEVLFYDSLTPGLVWPVDGGEGVSLDEDDQLAVEALRRISP